jgi:hypothetical protein
VEGSCEHGNELSGSIKFWVYFLSGWAIGSFSRRAQHHEWVSRAFLKKCTIIRKCHLFPSYSVKQMVRKNFVGSLWYLMGPCVPPSRVSDRGYLNFPLTFKVNYTKMCPLNAFSQAVSTWQRSTILESWSASVSWPTRSPDLNLLIFFCGDIWKSKSVPIESILEKNCEVKFNKFQINKIIYAEFSKACELLFHPELSRELDEHGGHVELLL